MRQPMQKESGPTIFICRARTLLRTDSRKRSVQLLTYEGEEGHDHSISKLG